MTALIIEISEETSQIAIHNMKREDATDVEAIYANAIERLVLAAVKEMNQINQRTMEEEDVEDDGHSGEDLSTDADDSDDGGAPA